MGSFSHGGGRMPRVVALTQKSLHINIKKSRMSLDNQIVLEARGVISLYVPFVPH